MSTYRKTTMPIKRVAMKILTAYGRGVTSITEGVEYTAFGRDQEVLKFDSTLRSTREGSGNMQGYVGPYGVGKSFILALFQNLAIKKDFVVMNADISREAWFAGTQQKKQGLNLYRELIRSTAIKGKTRDAFDTILQKWYVELRENTNGSYGEICKKFDQATKECAGLTMYNDIRNVICTRFRELNENIDNSEAMNFIYARYSLKTEARRVGASDYIHDESWFGVMNTWAHILVCAGYKGLILLIDQVDYLTNLPKRGRQANYESMLSMWNAVNQGKTEYMSVCIFAAERLLNDSVKGTPSYVALNDRLMACTKLDILPNEHLVALLLRLKEIHEYAHGWESGLTEDDATEFVEGMLNNIGSISENCIRPISMAWINKLEDMQAGCLKNNSSYSEIAITEAGRQEEIEEPIPDEFPEF